MTPLALSIIIHYYGHADDFRAGDFSAPAVRDAIDEFEHEGLIAFDKDEAPIESYKITERGRVFVEALCKMPLPVQMWVMPSPNVPEEK